MTYLWLVDFVPSYWIFLCDNTDFLIPERLNLRVSQFVELDCFVVSSIKKKVHDKFDSSKKYKKNLFDLTIPR